MRTIQINITDPLSYDYHLTEHCSYPTKHLSI